jgi:hypothetical protein
MILKQTPTLVLKAVLILLALGVLAICSILLPMGIMSDQTGFYRPLLIGMYLPAIPFFIGIYQALKLLNLIDKNHAFSSPALKALRKIKFSAFSISALYLALLPYIFYVAELDDAPGVVLIGLVFVFASFVIGTFAAVLQKLIQNALDLKEENDLTV